MSDSILLQGMRFWGIHGVGADERTEIQPLEVDLEVQRDLRAAAASDDLADTLDYATLVDICRAVTEEGDARLLERVAGDIAARVLAVGGVEAVVVRVRKLAVPLDADLDFAQVQIRRSAAG